ncbi:GmrSD restriction endonuclease domain-containing protein [Neolewinella antarctica]|uniref:GmrSD restriction endonucleases N-terminal domain-containing protein n=1 Tax=Neolewinella antarctica TaxID=442734 RepID=A0ABX0XGJ7_9BACT|nr:DUF262 domain-containing protein [Neolewinella antarctica]NJC28450.1 hypothetical protein [Neolewinella antarctica]
MASLESGDKSYSTLLNEIETGQIKIPQFQRDFVWSTERSAKLVDSVLKGYPIGTFIYWRTNERLRSIKNIGKLDLPEPADGEFVNYVLDGQQRITSLFATLKGLVIKRSSGRYDDFSNIYVDLDANFDDEIVISDIKDREEYACIRLTDLMSSDRKFLNNFSDDRYNKIEKYKRIISSYQFKGINFKDAEIDEATDVFTRLNVGGKDLTLFEIMVAKTYDQEKKFDLQEKFTELTSELEEIKYETISSANVLQLVSLLITGECKRKAILKLDKKEFIEMWPEAVKCVKQAVFHYKAFGIPVSRLLPYNALIVPISYFYHKTKGKPNYKTSKMLEDFFWRTSLGFRYSSSVEAKLVQDIDKMDHIIAGSLPKYDWTIDVSTDNIVNNGQFAANTSFIKAILCLFTMQHPRSFDNDQEVNIHNSWLKIATSRNYHHFFPKGFLKKNSPEIEQWQYNHIANITIIDGELNKNKIRAKAPSKYMSEYMEENKNIENTMKTHLIDDIKDYGVLDDNYMKFFKKRCARISSELIDRIIVQVKSSEEE